ncbi:hypothetical protein A167_01480 [Alcanivorax sp. S71-1-4]|nr:hypothetical protein A167_01480 [Alcanivorax sp. S71-1-4]
MQLVSCGSSPLLAQFLLALANSDLKNLASAHFHVIVYKLPSNPCDPKESVYFFCEIMISIPALFGNFFDKVIDLKPLAVLNQIAHFAINVWKL